MSDFPLPPQRTDPRLGRYAFGAVVVGYLAFFLMNAYSFPTAGLGPVFGVVSAVIAFLGALILAIVSLVRGERRAWASWALLLLLGAPVVVFIVSMLVWWGYGLGMG